MKIGIIDADLMDNGTRHPNLALMKISAYYKDKGYHVKLLLNYEDIDIYDKVFISKVFSFTKMPDNVLNLPNVEIGGTGFFHDGGQSLPEHIEHHMPDYDLYIEYTDRELQKGRNRRAVADYLDYSIGFATRGCFRKCEFCVNKKYDRAFRHSPIKEFYNPDKPFIYLWDDNILAYERWDEIFDELEQIGKPFQFRQGLDIRLLTEKKAQKLSKAKYHGDFIFAFDFLKDREIIEKKLKMWKRYSSKTTKLYVLCAYESLDEKDIESVFQRIEILMKYGCLPYIMRYENYKASPWKSLYIQIARWCNQPNFFKKMSFRQFCEANQSYHKNKDTNCAAYQAMLNFEDAFPEIAQKYFDIRFEEINQYANDYGYGRIYANKPDCELCQNKQQTWDDAFLEIMKFEKVLERYFKREMDFQCLSYPEIQCIKSPKEEIVNWFCEKLQKTPLSSIYDIIREHPISEDIQPYNIPQFSNLTDAYIETPNVLCSSGKAMTFDELGVYLGNGKNKSKVAQRKYGENHAKLATQLDLTVIRAPSNSYRVSISIFGRVFHRLEERDKKELIVRLLFRIPVIQKILKDAYYRQVDLDEELLCLSQKTLVRRRSNIIYLLRFISENKKAEDVNLKKALNNIKEL